MKISRHGKKKFNIISCWYVSARKKFDPRNSRHTPNHPDLSRQMASREKMLELSWYIKSHHKVFLQYWWLGRGKKWEKAWCPARQVWWDTKSVPGFEPILLAQYATASPVTASHKSTCIDLLRSWYDSYKKCYWNCEHKWFYGIEKFKTFWFKP